MSKPLVLVAGLYEFLAPICDKQERETSMKGSNEQWQGKKHHKQIELLAVAYVLLFSCLFIHYISFSFFSTFFFALILLIYIFSSKERTRTKHKKKCELNWIKDVVYTESELWSQMHAKLDGPETQFSWSNFTILIFVNLATPGWNGYKNFCSSPYI